MTSSHTKQTLQKWRQRGPSRQRWARTIPKCQGKASFHRRSAARPSSSARCWVPLSCSSRGGCQAALPRLPEEEQMGKHSIADTKHGSYRPSGFTPNTVHTVLLLGSHQTGSHRTRFTTDILLGPRCPVPDRHSLQSCCSPIP